MISLALRKIGRSSFVVAIVALGAIATSASAPVGPDLKKNPAPGAAKTSVPASETASPETPREYFNAGTQQLQRGKLREAETFLERALASQSSRLQPIALYNLGHVRFGQGIDELKKGPAAKPTVARARTAAQQTDEAIRMADDALAGNDVQKMVAAYMRGRGARKEFKAATQVVQRALQTHGATLARWQRSWGDFKSALELKGRIPGPNMPPGGGGDDDEDEDNPFGPRPDQKEGPSKEGQEMPMSPEQAGWLLDGFRLDGDRRLPMGQDGKAEPKDRTRPTW